MADDRFTASLQVSVLAALCFDEGYGAAVASQVKPDYFDDIWRPFVTKVLRYRKQYNRAPGPTEVGDFVDQLAGQRGADLLQKQLVPELLAEADHLNAEYAATRVGLFVRRQVMKSAIFEAGDRFAQDDDRMVDDVEAIFHKALRFRQQTLSAGTFLRDPKALTFLNQQDDVIPLGIKELDQQRIGLVRKELLLYIAPKGSGKSWFCVHAGKQAIAQRWRVAHISLEMSEAKVIGRYYQSLFGAAKTEERYLKTMFERDDLGRISGFKIKRNNKPNMHFTQGAIKGLLRKKMRALGTRFGDLVVKDFPTSTLTMDQLISYLDYLEEVEKFVPDLLIVDYPKLMHTNRRDIRVSIGANMEELRGLGGRRGMAILAPHQGTRSTIGARRVRSSDAGEDISVVQTADTVLSYSRTEAEERLGLGRIAVEHARDSHGGSTIVISQAYHTGQYVLDSELVAQAYWDKLKKFGGSADDEEEE